MGGGEDQWLGRGDGQQQNMTVRRRPRSITKDDDWEDVIINNKRWW